MSYTVDLKQIEKYDGQTVSNGQCAMFVYTVAHTPPTGLWKQGKLVKGDTTITPGTVIATFGDDGKYTNRLDGSAHAAFYISQDIHGIAVWDQWSGQPVHKRPLAFRNGSGLACNDGDKFYVVE